MTRKPTSALLLVLFMTAGLVAADLARPQAGQASGLALSTFRAMTVDGGHRRVFVSGGNSVVQLNYRGDVVATLSNIPGAWGLLVHENVLYVAANAAAKVFRYDLTQTPPSKLTPLPTDPFVQPRELVEAAGRLWFSGGDCGGDESIIGSMTFDGASVDQLPSTSSDHWTDCAQIDGSQRAPGILLAQSAQTDASLYEYDVSTTPPTHVYDKFSFSGPDYEVLPGGEQFVMDHAYQNGKVAAYSLADFSGPTQIWSLHSSWNAEAIAISEGGERGALMAVGSLGPDTNQLTIFRLNQPDPFRRITLPPDAGNGIWPKGVALAPDGSRVFVVSGFVYGDVVFDSIDPFTIQTSLRLTSRHSWIRYGNDVTLRAQLTGPPRLEGNIVSFYATPVGGSRHFLGTAKTDSTGLATFTAHPLKHTTYDARFAGGGDVLPTEAEALRIEVVTISVGAMFGWYARQNGYYLFHYHSSCTPSALKTCPIFGVKVTPNHAGKDVVITAQYKAGSFWHTASTTRVHLNSKSSAYIAFTGATVGGVYRAQARFVGDADHAGSLTKWARWRMTS